MARQLIPITTLLLCLIMTWTILNAGILSEMSKICGRRVIDDSGIRKRIIGGKQVYRGQWPWLVSVFTKTKSFDDKGYINKRSATEDFMRDYLSKKEVLMYIRKYLLEHKNEKTFEMIDGHVCGGTLISNEWIITAKHCIHDGIDYSVHIGEYHLDQHDPGETVRNISTVITHPIFDIALMKLDGPVEFNKYIQPACIANSSSVIENGQTCSVYGWGHDKYKGKVQSIPNYVDLPVFNSPECSIIWANFLVHTTHICAGELGKDACQFDSGGALTCQEKNSGLNYLTGIVHTGIRCGETLPGLYLDVRKFYNWIKAIVENEENTTNLLLEQYNV